jgi:hypothetical protein
MTKYDIHKRKNRKIRAEKNDMAEIKRRKNKAVVMS